MLLYISCGERSINMNMLLIYKETIILLARPWRLGVLAFS